MKTQREGERETERGVALLSRTTLYLGVDLCYCVSWLENRITALSCFQKTLHWLNAMTMRLFVPYSLVWPTMIGTRICQPTWFLCNFFFASNYRYLPFFSLGAHYSDHYKRCIFYLLSSVKKRKTKTKWQPR